MDENDFLKAFIDVDILKIESIASIIGRALASLHKGMLEGGMDSFTSMQIINAAVESFISAIGPMNNG